MDPQKGRSTGHMAVCLRSCQRPVTPRRAIAWGDREEGEGGRWSTTRSYTTDMWQATLRVTHRMIYWNGLPE